jgi:hypothetical protein
MPSSHPGAKLRGLRKPRPTISTHGKDHTPTAEQIDADQQAAKEWAAKHGVKRADPGTADQAVSMYPLPTAKPHGARGRARNIGGMA